MFQTRNHKLAAAPTIFWSAIVLLASMMIVPSSAQPLPVLQSDQFLRTPHLLAAPGQLVMLNAPADGVTNSFARYYLHTGGNHVFCVNGNSGIYLYSIDNHDTGQSVLLQLNAGLPGCKIFSVPAGTYEFRITRFKTSDSTRVSYVIVDPPPAPLVDEKGDALGGYWALQADPTHDLQSRDGQIMTLTTFFPEGLYIVANYDRPQISPLSHFQFRYGQGTDLHVFDTPAVNLNRLKGGVGGFLGTGSCTCANQATYCTGDEVSGYRALAFCAPDSALRVTDHGYSWFGLQFQSSHYGTLDYRWSTAAPVQYAALEANPGDTSAVPARFRALYRYYDDGVTGDLREGEVALYTQCNYQGPAIVVTSEMVDFLKFSGGEVPLRTFGLSVRLGNNTGINLFQNTRFSGTTRALTTDTPCIASPFPLASFQVFSLRNAFLATGGCPGCRMEGADFSQMDLTGVNLSGAKLTNAHFNGAILERANLQGADLSFAQLFGARLDIANLTGASLYHAFLANNVDGNISASASVRQAHLKNANLSYAELSGVDFTDTNFYGDNASAPTSCSTTGDAGSGFTQGCASASNAVMTNTTFTNAYLFGTDFSGAKGQGVTFSQATLVGASFSGADFGIYTGTGQKTTFYRALLQGADLSNTKLDQVDFTQAQVDFRDGGNNIYVYLDGGNHNQFACSPDCQPTSGSDVCVYVNYPKPSKLPTDNKTILCPDGSAGSCGNLDPSGNNSRWKSGIADIGMPPSGVPPAWYDQDATYTKALAVDSPLICKGQGANSSVTFW